MTKIAAIAALLLLTACGPTRGETAAAIARKVGAHKCTLQAEGSAPSNGAAICIGGGQATYCLWEYTQLGEATSLDVTCAAGSGAERPQ